jgi:hypothetical protein
MENNNIITMKSGDITYVIRNTTREEMTQFYQMCMDTFGWAVDMDDTYAMFDSHPEGFWSAFLLECGRMISEYESMNT